MKAYKTEIKPSQKQIGIIEQTFGNTRYLYNTYLSYNQKVYEETKGFVSGYDYAKMLTNDPKTPEWLKKSPSKANKKAIMDAESAFKGYFNKRTGFPKFKSKKHSKDSFYLIGTIKVERHRIFLPVLKWVKLKEFGYIPKGIKSVTVSKDGDRYFISCLVSEETDHRICTNPDLGLGIDLGIKDLAIVSNGAVYKNINRSPKVKKLEKRLKRAQRSLSRMYDNNMINKVYYKSDKKKGHLKSYDWKKPLKECANIRKQQRIVKLLYKRLTNIRNNYILQIINEIVKQKPRFITVENLNVKGLMKNKHLAKDLANQKLSFFVTRLTQKCNELGIELRKVSRFYSSSQICSECGIKYQPEKQGQPWSLKIREWTCVECGTHHDRDLNAAYNLRNAKEYAVATVQ